MRQYVPIAAAVLALVATGLRADFSYEQSTKITGGAMAGIMRMAGAFSKQARMPVKTQIMLKGDRMAHLNGDTGQIIDLSSETITDINFAKKTYSVVTFAQMAEAMKKMSERMHQDPEADVNFKIDLKDTGAARDIQGLSTHQMVMTLSGLITDKKTGRQGEMKIVSDMWLTKDVKGYDEVRAFQRRMAEKMAFTPGGMGGGMMPPGMMKGMSEISKQAAKMEGVPVLQLIRIGDAPAAGAGTADAPRPPQQQTTQAAPAPSASDAAAGAIAGRLGRLGGLGGFGRKKKPQEEPKPEQPAPDAQPAAESAAAPAQAAPGSLMEMTTELTTFSAAPVDSSKVQVPSGFKQVESEMLKFASDK